MIMRSILLVFIGSFFVSLLQAQKPWDAAPRNEKWWLDRHRQIVNASASLGSQIKIVFLGSSLIEFWANEGRPVWAKNYAHLGAINYGVGGDQTQQVLWRIQEGELDGLTPKLVVLYIGSNNVPVFPDNDEIVRGVDLVVTRLHEKLPNANILLVSTFPRADQPNVKYTMERIRNINEKLRLLVDGDSERNSHTIDLFWELALPSMEGIKRELYISDNLHLHQRGYEIWAREMNATFYSLMDR